jgi:hypothetical protein
MSSPYPYKDIQAEGFFTRMLFRGSRIGYFLCSWYKVHGTTFT